MRLQAEGKTVDCDKPAGTAVRQDATELRRRLGVDKRPTYRVRETLQEDLCFAIEKDRVAGAQVPC